MGPPRSLGSALVVLTLLGGAQGSLSAQAVEASESSSQRQALLSQYGALIGGAYPLVETGYESTKGMLKWGVAGGAAAGAVVGLVYVLNRSQPRGSADAVGTVDARNGGLRFGVPSLRVGRLEDVGGRRLPTIEANLFQARFR